jgi:hypothetical protein
MNAPGRELQSETSVRESYPLADDPSSPALPELPEPPRVGFQFGMKLLLSLMLVTALLATGAHYGLLYLARLNQQLPAYHQHIFLSEAILISVLLAAWFYLFVRTLFLARHAVRIGRRWRAAQRHRRALESWLVARRQALSQQSPRDSSPRLK